MCLQTSAKVYGYEIYQRTLYFSEKLQTSAKVYDYEYITEPYIFLRQFFIIALSD